jgi:hypothetical protein
MAKVEVRKQDALTEALGRLLKKLWDAYTAFDAETHNGILAEDYRAVHPDGTVHLGKPTREEIAAAPIADYWLREFEAWPIGDGAALATYAAEVEVRNQGSVARFRLAVGEVWAKRGGEWKCRYYHATMLK